jgi:hypothetical protein
MKRFLAAIAFTAALVAPTGLLSTVATAAGASPPVLKAMLLSLGQMPAGWSVANSAGGKADMGCYTDNAMPKGVKQTATATANFQGKGGLPTVGEKLATFTNGTTSYAETVANLAACKHFSGTSGGEKVTGGTVEKLKLPHYGTASEAFVVIFTISGMRFYQDLLYVQKANIVMALFEGNIQSVNMGQFQGFANKAVAKLA